MAVIAPVGAPASFSPDMLLRQVLHEGLAYLASDPQRVADLYGRFDDLASGSQADMLADFQARLKTLVAWGDAEALQIHLGYPHDDAVLPCVSIVHDAGSEQPGAATYNDLMSASHELSGVDDPGDWSTQSCIQYRHQGVDYTSQLQLGSWATSPEESWLIHEAVRAVMLTDKGFLRKAGVMDVSVSESGFAPDNRMRPRVAWVPMLSVRMDWFMRQTSRIKVPSRAQVTLSFSN
jgi:hypothetical protein